MAEIRDIWLQAHNMLRSGRQIINRELRPLGLSSAEGNIVLHLWTQSQQMRQDQLAEQLDVSTPAISRALDSLEKKGYVIRQPDTDDKRVHQIHLTDKAVTIGAEIEQVYNRVFTLAVQGISPAELDDFMNLFSRISDNFAREQAQTK